MKAEIRQVLSDHGVTKMSMRPVRRSYAFEDRAVAPGEQWVLKVKYPGNQAALPAGLRGAADAGTRLLGNTALTRLLMSVSALSSPCQPVAATSSYRRWLINVSCPLPCRQAALLQFDCCS